MGAHWSRSRANGSGPPRGAVLDLTPAAGRDELVDRLRGVLLGASEPDERTALLISVLRAFVPFRSFTAKRQVKEAERRAKEIRERLGDDERLLIEAVFLSIDAGGGSDVSAP